MRVTVNITAGVVLTGCYFPDVGVGAVAGAGMEVDEALGVDAGAGACAGGSE